MHTITWHVFLGHFGGFGFPPKSQQAEIWLKLDRLQELIDETGQQASIGFWAIWTLRELGQDRWKKIRHFKERYQDTKVSFKR